VPKASVVCFQAVDVVLDQRVRPKPKTGEMEVVIWRKSCIVRPTDDAFGFQPAKQRRNLTPIALVLEKLERPLKQPLVVLEVIEE
jgi:hypothetical protein